jgi:hypothetical protein
MLILDAQGEELSLLLPTDDENRRRRADILAAVSLPDAPAGGTAPASGG